MRARPRYQTEPIQLRDIIWRQGFITPLQMMRIAAWKSARGLASLTLNDEAAIEIHTRQLLRSIEPWRNADVLHDAVDWAAWERTAATAIGSKRGRTGLLALDGFGYPMASAFLAVLAPTVFPVIDRWAVNGLYGSSIGNYQRAHVYTDFARGLVAHAKHFAEERTMHELDIAMMSAAMKCRHVERPCERLPFLAAAFPA